VFARQPWNSFQGWQSRVRFSITFLWVCSSAFIAEFREDIREIIRTIAGRLNDSDSDIRNAVLELLLKLAEMGMN